MFPCTYIYSFLPSHSPPPPQYTQLVRTPLADATPSQQLVESLAPMWAEEQTLCEQHGSSMPQPPASPPRHPHDLCLAVEVMREQLVAIAHQQYMQEQEQQQQEVQELQEEQQQQQDGGVGHMGDGGVGHMGDGGVGIHDHALHNDHAMHTPPSNVPVSTSSSMPVSPHMQLLAQSPAANVWMDAGDAAAGGGDASTRSAAVAAAVTTAAAAPHAIHTAPHIDDTALHIDDTAPHNALDIGAVTDMDWDVQAATAAPVITGTATTTTAAATTVADTAAAAATALELAHQQEAAWEALQTRLMASQPFPGDEREEEEGMLRALARAAASQTQPTCR